MTKGSDFLALIHRLPIRRQPSIALLLTEADAAMYANKQTTKAKGIRAAVHSGDDWIV